MPTLSYQVYLTDDQKLAAREMDARPRDLVKGLLARADTAHPDLLMHKDTLLGQWGDQPVCSCILDTPAVDHVWVHG